MSLALIGQCSGPPEREGDGTPFRSKRKGESAGLRVRDVSSITVTRGASGLKSEVLIVANECRRKVSGQKDRVRCEHIPRDIFSKAILPCAGKRAAKQVCPFRQIPRWRKSQRLDCAAMSALVERARVNGVRDDLTLGVKRKIPFLSKLI